MVEQWSSKSHVWVRFLLSLILKKSLKKSKNSRASYYTKKSFKPQNKYFKNILNLSFLGSNLFFKKKFNVWTYKKNLNLRNSDPVQGFNFLFVSNKLRFARQSVKRLESALILIKPRDAFFFSPALYHINFNRNSTSLFQNSNTSCLSFFNFYKNNFLLPLRVFFDKFNFSKNTSILNKSISFTNTNFNFRNVAMSKLPTSLPTIRIRRNGFKFSHDKKIIFIYRSIFSLELKNLKKFFRFRTILKKKKNFSLSPYLSYSRIFFNNLNLSKKLKGKTEASVFKIQLYDYFNEFVIRLTPQSLNYSFFDLLKLPNNFFTTYGTSFNLYSRPYLFGLKMPLFINSHSINDDFFATRFKFLKSKLSPNHYLSSYLNKHFFKNYNYYSKFDLNNIKLVLENTFFSFTAQNSSKLFTYSSRGVDKSRAELFNNKFFTFFYTTSRTSSINFLFTNMRFLKYHITQKFFSFQKNEYSGFFPLVEVASAVCFNFFDKYLNLNSFKKNLYTNIFPTNSFSYVFRKYVIKSFRYHKFSFLSMPWHYNSLIKFIEYSSGKKVFLNFNSFLNNVLDSSEIMRCEIWSQRLKSFKKSLGPKLFINESLQIIYTSLKIKDPFFLSNWLLNFFYKISFWKFKLVFRYLQYVLRYFFWSIFTELKMKGLKFQLKGKVSVAGNSRTRTVVNKIGLLSNSTLKNKILYDLNLIRTFTGVIGFKTWLVF